MSNNSLTPEQWKHLTEYEKKQWNCLVFAIGEDSIRNDVKKLWVSLADERIKSLSQAEQIRELEEDVVQEECKKIEDCPTFYDGCNCKGANKYLVETFELKHIIDQRDSTITAQAKVIEAVKPELIFLATMHEQNDDMEDFLRVSEILTAICEAIVKHKEGK